MAWACLLVLAACTFSTRPITRPDTGFEAIEVVSDLVIAPVADGRLSILPAGTILVGDRIRAGDGAILFSGATRDGEAEGFTCLAREHDGWRAGAQYLHRGPLLRPGSGTLRSTRA